MASAETPPAPTADDNDNVVAVALAPSESEPLLGRPGDAVQKPDAPMISNLWLGTGWIALVGIALLVAVVWAAVFTHPTLPLVTPHPLLQTLGVAILVLAILVLQPTGATPRSKIVGQRWHAGLQVLSLGFLGTGVIVIEANKFKNAGEHFHSAHGYCGVIFGLAVLFQQFFGVSMWGAATTPQGEAFGRSLWKYHRYTGYFVLLAILATVITAAQTDYAVGVLEIKGWAVWLAAGLIVAGVFPRISLQKLGIRRGQ